MSPSFAEMWRVFGRIGLLSFGGPAAQIALMHKELVDDRPWLTEKQFLGALSFCMLLPGPEAMQLATYTGWRLRGTLGGLLAGLLFVLPGAAVILALAVLYVNFGEIDLVQAGFVGVKAAVVVVVLQALWKVSNKALKGPFSWSLAAIAFVAIYVLQLPFPFIIACAALLGALRKVAPREPQPLIELRPASETLRIILIWAGLWAAPVLIVVAFDHRFLIDIALFFSNLAVVTFGGAYAVLAYMTQTVTLEHGWISTTQMIDALGLAETTPGPLILVTEFVGLLAGYYQSGIMLMLAAGALTLWCTFVPCFLWIFAAAPFVEWLLSRPRLNQALNAITAAVVGVILNLSIWFGLHVVFSEVGNTNFGAAPALSSFQWLPLALIALAAWLLMRRKLALPWVLVICAVCAVGLSGF
ncbi:chromate efflux transporter [Cognatishimia sp. WU-CL00825]|uniref:chromate efflux transporter n=1 Tax=Cognatishimia sp. WU-CL00825 TaxID=3127658 RepID=UPI0031026C47